MLNNQLSNKPVKIKSVFGYWSLMIGYYLVIGH